ncbi:putative endonuclease [Kitasatospora herbaricolor]|uniref:YraN family protein n=1 Tax=Kitasatospora herbaricolor TaxID=68217 RepID=UPI0017495934|nr:putative endonuclease [Kitasatospora herbaricolor]
MQDTQQSTTERTQRTKPPARKSTTRSEGGRPRRATAAGARKPGTGRAGPPSQNEEQGAARDARGSVTARRPAEHGAGTGRSTNNGLGRYGEQVAARRLVADGLRILERNWRCAEGELDIVALDGETLAVCEVKTRSERSFQQPTEAIDAVKADRLRRLAERWLAERWPVHFAALAEGVNAPGQGPSCTTAAGASGAGTRPFGVGASGTGSPGQEEPRAGSDAVGRATERDAGTSWPTPPPPGGVRIDLVAVINRIKGAATVEHLRGVV